MLATGKIASTN